MSHGYYEILNCEWLRRKQHRKEMRESLEARPPRSFPVNAVWLAAVLELGPKHVLMAAERVAIAVVGTLHEQEEVLYASDSTRLFDKFM